MTADVENPFAGQGPVLLDIGGDSGALVVTMPSHTVGLEVEIRPVGSTAADDHAHDHSHAHAHDHSHPHGHHHGHSHEDTHAYGGTAYPHVAVVARPGRNGPAHTLVYPSVPAGTYDLVPMPGDAVVMTAQVTGGAVTTARWPGA